MTTEPTPEKQRSPLAAVFLTVVIDLMGFGIVLPLLPLYADTYQASPALVSLLFICFSVTQFISAPLWGRLSDRIGRRPVILIGLCGSTASYVLFGLAPLLAAPLAWLFISRIVAGVFGGTIATAYAFIADVTDEKERGRGMALIGAAFGIGFTLGPIIGGFGHDLLSPSAPGFIAAGFSAFALLFAWKRLPEPNRHKTRVRNRVWLDIGAFKQAMRRPGIGSLLIILFLSVTCFALLESTLSLLAKKRHGYDVREVAWLFSWLGFWSALNQGYIVRKMLKKLPETALLKGGPYVLGFGLLAMGLADSQLYLLLVAPIPVLGFGMLTASANSLLSKRSPADQQGGIMGVSQSLQSMARIAGPAVGLNAFAFGAGLPFFIGAGLMLLPLILGRREGSSGTPDSASA